MLPHAVKIKTTGDCLLQKAPRGDAPSARNAPSNAVAAARLFAQPGVSPVPQPLRSERRDGDPDRPRHR